MQVDRRIEEFVREGLSNGYSITSIKHLLITEGYDFKYVEYVISEVETQLKKNAVEYIKANVKDYSLTFIRQSLMIIQRLFGQIFHKHSLMSSSRARRFPQKQLSLI